MSSGLKRYLTIFLKGGLAVGLLVLVMSRVDWGVFFETIVDANVIWVGGVVAVHVADRFFMSAKWRYLLKRMGVRVSLRTALVHIIRGGFAERVVQWGMGGDIARTVGLGRETGQTEPAVLSVIIEKVTGLSALGVLVVCSFYILNVKNGFVSWYWLFPVSIFCVAGLFWLPFGIFRDSAAPWIVRIRRAIPFEKIRNWLSQLPDLWKHWHVGTDTLLTFYGLTAVEQLVPTANLLLLGSAFGLGVSAVEAFSVMPIVTFFDRLPITIQALGVREGLYVVMLSFIGVGTAEAFALALTVRVSQTTVFGIGALLTVPLPDRKEVKLNSD